jgi:plastocyanin domain-containing protein
MAACGEPSEMPSPQSQEPSGEQSTLSTAILENGEQVMHVTIASSGYEPDAFELRAGIPARLVFTRTAENTCATHIQIPDLGIEKTEIPLNEPVEITLAPPSSGTYAFVCGMDMLAGTIVVKS